MFAGSRFCARCGAEAAREAVENATPMSCPRCAEPLEALRLGTTTLRECAACGGLWVDPATLQTLSDSREQQAAVASALAAHVPTRDTAPDTVRYIRCPQCAKVMNRVNFARSSGVIMDVCKVHGIWLDRGELRRVVGFVERGGLAAAREHERQQLARERQQLKAARAAGGTPGGALGGITITTTRSVSSGETSVDQLLRDAVGLLLGR